MSNMLPNDITQKVECYPNHQAWKVAALISEQIANGWLVVTMTTYEFSVIVIYQKTP